MGHLRGGWAAPHRVYFLCFGCCGACCVLHIDGPACTAVFRFVRSWRTGFFYDSGDVLVMSGLKTWSTIVVVCWLLYVPYLLLGDLRRLHAVIILSKMNFGSWKRRPRKASRIAMSMRSPIGLFSWSPKSNFLARSFKACDKIINRLAWLPCMMLNRAAALFIAMQEWLHSCRQLWFSIMSVVNQQDYETTAVTCSMRNNVPIYFTVDSRTTVYPRSCQTPRTHWQMCRPTGLTS